MICNAQKNRSIQAAENIIQQPEPPAASTGSRDWLTWLTLAIAILSFIKK